MQVISTDGKIQVWHYSDKRFDDESIRVIQAVEILDGYLLVEVYANTTL